MTTAQQTEMYDACGNRIPGDILPDGGRVRIPMLMMDGVPDIADITRRAFADAPDASDGIMHRPGYIRSSISDAIAKTQQVLRDARLDQQQELWRNPPPLEIKKDAAAPVADVDAAAARRDQRVRDAWKAGA